MLLEGWPGDRSDDDDEDATANVRANTSVSARKDNEHYQAIRTARYIYVETDNDLPELYDLKVDPYQITNVVNDPHYKKTVKKLSKRLANGDY